MDASDLCRDFRLLLTILLEIDHFGLKDSLGFVTELARGMDPREWRPEEQGLFFVCT